MFVDTCYFVIVVVVVSVCVSVCVFLVCDYLFLVSFFLGVINLFRL